MTEDNLTPAANGAVDQETDAPDIQLPEFNDAVTLSSEQYAAVLDHIATLEAKIMEGPQGRKEVQTLDNLVDEAGSGQKRVGDAPPSNLPLDQMSPEQVIGHIFQAIQKQYIEPLEVKVETLRLMSEIDKVANTKGNEDFWEYANAVKEIALKNPTLSIQRAYHLAKQEGKRGPNTQGEPGLQKKNEVLFTLPQRPRGVTGGGGEKPGGPTRGMTRGSEDLSRKDAASQAFDAAVKGAK